MRVQIKDQSQKASFDTQATDYPGQTPINSRLDESNRYRAIYPSWELTANNTAPWSGKHSS